MPARSDTNAYTLTVTLNTTVDTMLRYRHNGGRHALQEQTSVAGGKGLNVSRALRRLKQRSYATGIVGGETGGRIEGLLRQEKLPYRFYHNTGDSRENLILCLPRVTAANRVFRQTPAIDAAGYRRFRRLYRELLAGARLVALSGSVLEGLPATVYADLIRDARARNIPALLDTGGAALREGLKAQPTFIKPNHSEIQQATGIRVRSLSDGLRAVAAFGRWRIPHVYLSLGDKGAIGCNRNELWYAKAPKVSVRNTVGCGDAFVAAVCAAHLDNLSFPESLSLAVAAGTVNATNIVPGLIDPDAVRRTAGRIKLKNIPF